MRWLVAWWRQQGNILRITSIQGKKLRWRLNKQIELGALESLAKFEVVGITHVLRHSCTSHTPDALALIKYHLPQFVNKIIWHLCKHNLSCSRISAVRWSWKRTFSTSNSEREEQEKEEKLNIQPLRVAFATLELAVAFWLGHLQCTVTHRHVSYWLHCE
jgi:hypothetical protein